jgi:hypothetical protein
MLALVGSDEQRCELLSRALFVRLLQELQPKDDTALRALCAKLRDANAPLVVHRETEMVGAAELPKTLAQLWVQELDVARQLRADPRVRLPALFEDFQYLTAAAAAAADDVAASDGERTPAEQLPEHFLRDAGEPAHDDRRRSCRSARHRAAPSRHRGVTQPAPAPNPAAECS